MLASQWFIPSEKNLIMTLFTRPFLAAVFTVPLFLCNLGSIHAQTESTGKRPIGIGPSSSKSLDGELVIRQRLERFFTSVSEKEVKKAYTDLLTGSKIGENAENVDGLVERTQKVLDVYGTMATSELIRTERIGSRLARFVYFSYGADFPLQWEFYCYRSPDEKWQLLDITVNNDLDMMFDRKSASQVRKKD